MTKTIYLVDASIYIFRAWFSLPDTMTNQEGNAVNAVRGFFDFVVRFLQTTTPHNIVFAFDQSLEHSHRNEIYPPYKENREPAPPELKRQFEYCRELVRSFGISEVAHTHYEADDLIGTVAAKSRAAGYQVVIVTSDKDLAQLLKQDDIWWDYIKKRRLDAQGVKEHFGVIPEQIADWLALAGDSVDNIPGVPGIGLVSARKLIDHFGNLENLLGNLDEISKIKGLRGADRILRLISENTESLLVSRKLTEIYCEVPMEDFSTELKAPDKERFQALSQTLDMKDYHLRIFERCLETLPSKGTH